HAHFRDFAAKNASASLLPGRRAMKRPLLAAAAGLALLAAPQLAHAADDAFVVLVDDGSLASNPFTTGYNVLTAQNTVLDLYGATGLELPEVLSGWTTFPLGSSAVGTIFDPIGADVKGIGLDAYFPPDGTLDSPYPP